jgi:hypothetical protein
VITGAADGRRTGAVIIRWGTIAAGSCLSLSDRPVLPCRTLAGGLQRMSGRLPLQAGDTQSIIM